MRQWLYKTTDTETAAGERRPDLETTRALIVEDKILCRGAFNRGTHRKTNLVWRVAPGDLLHVYHRQYAQNQGVRFIGSFRVADPGPARFDPECALARVRDTDLAERLRAAYDIPAADPVTGWLLEAAGDTAEPDESVQLNRFLSGQNTLVEYHPPRARAAAPEDGIPASAAAKAALMRRTKDEVARELIAWHFWIAPEITEVYRFYDEEEERSDEPIKLLEVTSESSETGRVDTFGFDPAGDITYPSTVAQITPHELELIRRGQIDLPPGWDLSTARRFLREEFSPAPLQDVAS